MSTLAVLPSTLIAAPSILTAQAPCCSSCTHAGTFAASFAIARLPKCGGVDSTGGRPDQNTLTMRWVGKAKSDDKHMNLGHFVACAATVLTTMDCYQVPSERPTNRDLCPDLLAL